jgi:ketosteroid isomerase-like protein
MNTKIVLDFVSAINNIDVDGIHNLISEDHLFIDSQDNRMYGREEMKKAWISYFSIFPDYKIEIMEIFEKESLICILGYASGTYKGIQNENNSNYWRIPAAWTAIVSDKKIKQWQVYADNIIIADIIKRNN